MRRKNPSSGLFWGSIIILIGILFLLDNFYMVDFGDLIATFWPVILIALGIKMLLDRRKQDRPPQEQTGGKFQPETQNYDGQNSISENNVFGDVVLKIKSEKFSGGSVNNVFGDIRIDLSEALPESDLIKLYTSGVFGDISIIAPSGISLKVNANSVAGDITIKGSRKDGLFPNLNYQDADFDQASRKIVIQSSLVFGSINIS